MKRIDIIYEFIEKEAELYTRENIKNCGVDALEISKATEILRNNVSKELNELCRLRKLVKLKKRPVKYFHRKALEDILSLKINEEEIDEEILDNMINYYKKDEMCPFDYLIGASTSLKTQIEQAKAAIMYPPNGLNTLIVGSTGVGKSLFANRMYAYGKYIKKFKEESPFIVFNCADYYNNPQLLLSQIFGHVKGAFTGADSDKKGLVEQADGGMLFLDEIHRLPPEGQEMIFYFMDTGTFNKLGETERKRRANVLIVGATTEDPTSAMLKTFIRRIPIIISIPNFEERSIEDRVDIIKELLHNEAVRVNKPINITMEAVKALIGSTTFGNIGQLKSNIQLLCAKGFLNGLNDRESIDITLDIMPQKIKVGLLNLGNRKKENEEITKILPSDTIIYPNKIIFKDEIDNYEPPFNIYKIIEDKSMILKNEGMPEDEINKFINNDINVHIKCFYDNFKSEGYSREKLLKIVDNRIIKFSENVKNYVEKKLGKKHSEKFVYAFSLHLNALLTRVNSLEYENNISIEECETYEVTAPFEYEISKNICSKIENEFNVKLNCEEISYITLLLTSVEDRKKDGDIGIVVIAHGSSTASSMANVAIKLFDNENIVAVDMPLDISPKETLGVVKEKVLEIDSGKGVLLLVDMGSLNSFGNIIYDETKIKVRSLDMVSTPTVLEAARKSLLDDMTLDELYLYLKEFKGYNVDINNNKERKKAILSICATGDGAALKIKEFIENIVSSKCHEDIEIINIGIKEAKNKVHEILEERDLIAIVGSIDPKVGIPFISLEHLIEGSGDKILENLFKGKEILFDTKKNDIVLEKLCYSTLKETITYFNPNKITGLLVKFTKEIEENLNVVFSNSVKLRIILHTACILERVLLKDQLEYRDDKNKVDNDTLEAIRNATKIFQDTLNLTISEDEMCYLVEIVLI